MLVLVAQNSTHDATERIAEGVAEQIAEGVRAAGQATDARPLCKACEVAGFQGFVIGANYSASWLKDLRAFVKSNQDLLLRRTAWLFSSDPACGEYTGAKGVSARQSSESEELSGFQMAIGPRDQGIFFHALDRHNIGGAESAYPRVLDMGAVQPEGDFRERTQVVESPQGMGVELTHLAEQLRQDSDPFTERTDLRSKWTHTKPSNRWESLPVAFVPNRRTTTMKTLGTASFVLLGAFLTLVIVWSSFGLRVAGFSTVALTTGAALFILEAKLFLFFLDRRASAESDCETAERDRYETDREYYFALPRLSAPSTERAAANLPYREHVSPARFR